MRRRTTKDFNRWVKGSEEGPLLPRVTIGPYVIASFGFIILSMLMGDAVILWQFHVVRVHAERLNGIDQKLTALLRVHASLLVFHDRLEALSQAEDADRLAKEAGPLRTAVLEDTQRAKSALRLLPSDLQQDPSLLTTLLTIQNALPSELEAITGLAAAGDWRAVRARLANQVRPLESLASALVERVDQEAAEEQAEAVLNIRSVQRRAFVVVPMTAISLCVLTLLAMLWTVYQIRVRALERRQVEVRALNEQLVKAQEAERMRIAGDLHDGVLQQITSLVLRLGMVKRQVPPDSEAKATVSGLQQELIRIGSDIRHLSHELHPALLHAGLPAALYSYCEEFSKVRGLPVECATDESVKELSPGAALCLYRIAQEALGNAAKHSAAKKVEVRLTRSDGRVCLSVSDDGVGCAPDQIGKSGGLGLINMRERVLQLNGTFEFDGEPRRGTRVRVTVPFRPAS